MSAQTNPKGALAVLDAAVAQLGCAAAVDLTEARAAIAELIEAVGAFRGKRGAFMALGAQDARTIRLWAALARVGGGK